MAGLGRLTTEVRPGVNKGRLVGALALDCRILIHPAELGELRIAGGEPQHVKARRPENGAGQCLVGARAEGDAARPSHLAPRHAEGIAGGGRVMQDPCPTAPPRRAAGWFRD